MKTCRLWKISRTKKGDAYVITLKEPKKLKKDIFINKYPVYYYDPLIPLDNTELIKNKEKDIVQNMEKMESEEKLKSTLTYYSVSEGNLVNIILLCDLYQEIHNLINNDNYISVINNGISNIRIFKERLPYHNPYKILDPNKNIYVGNQKLLDGLVIVDNDKDYHFGIGSFNQLYIMMDEVEIKGSSKS